MPRPRYRSDDWRSQKVTNVRVPNDVYLRLVQRAEYGVPLGQVIKRLLDLADKVEEKEKQ